MAGAIPVQTQEDLVPPAPAAIGYRWTGVLLAPAVAVALQLVLVGPVGLTLPTMAPGSDTLEPVPVLTVFIATLVLSVLGAISVMLLERGLGGPRGRRIWVLVAVGVFVLSLGTIFPLDVSIGDKWGLALLHIAVAGVLIPTLSNGEEAGPINRDL